MKILANPGPITYSDTGILIDVDIDVSDSSLAIDTVDFILPVEIPHDTVVTAYYDTLVRAIQEHFEQYSITLLQKDISIVGWAELEYADPYNGYDMYDEFLDQGTNKIGDLGWTRVSSGTTSTSTLGLSDHFGAISLFTDSLDAVNSLRYGLWHLNRVTNVSCVVG